MLTSTHLASPGDIDFLHLWMTRLNWTTLCCGHLIRSEGGGRGGRMTWIGVNFNSVLAIVYSEPVVAQNYIMSFPSERCEDY